MIGCLNCSKKRSVENKVAFVLAQSREEGFTNLTSAAKGTTLESTHAYDHTIE